MKNSNYLLLSVVALMVVAVSCRKEHDEVVTKVVDVMLTANQAFTYTMPASGNADEIMEISQQPKHFVLCQITPDSVNNTLLEYTPELNYTGTDEIRVNTVEGNHHCGNHHQGGNNQNHFGNCMGNHHDVEVNYVFNITIIRATQPD